MNLIDMKSELKSEINLADYKLLVIYDNKRLHHTT